MSTALATPEPTGRAEWLQRRRRGIGASDMPAILGLSPYRTALDVYMDKIGEGVEVQDNDAMEFGRDMEPVIAKRYERRTGRKLVGLQVEAVCPSTPYLIATLDAERDDRRPVEFKTTRFDAAFGEDGSDDLPDHILAQVHHQMIVADHPVADVAVIIGGTDFRVYTVERNAEVETAIRKAADEFWDRVIDRRPPPIITPSDIRHVPSLFGSTGPEITLTDEQIDDWAEYQRIGQQEAALSVSRNAIRARLFAALGPAVSGVFPDGSRIVRTLTTRKEHTVKESTFAQLRFKKAGPR